MFFNVLDGKLSDGFLFLKHRDLKWQEGKPDASLGAKPTDILENVSSNVGQLLFFLLMRLVRVGNPVLSNGVITGSVGQSVL